MVKRILSKEKIIEGEIQLIKNDSPLNFSVLANYLGVKPQALYPYFKNQMDLNYAVLSETIDKLNELLKSQLLGMTGKSALIQLALISRNEGLKNIKLVHFIITIPPRNAPAFTKKSINELRSIFNSLLATAFKHEDIQLLAGRMIRNLIYGELLNVGTGWFSNKKISQTESFKWMISESLNILDKADENFKLR